ncbi:hypothetical protein ALDI51_17350 [Alicycliphilus denitrificans]|nr:hypothetical protein ALDI51_17350 [Alicycliphilus denitrificans]
MSRRSTGLRSKEDTKTLCGEAHFVALQTGESPALYVRATLWGDVLKMME